MKKYIFTIAILSIVPSVAFASWWNPFSWGIFSSSQPNPQVQIISTTTSSDNFISTSTAVMATTSINVTPTPTPPVSQPVKKIVQKVSPLVATPVSVKSTSSTCPQGYNCAPTIPTQSQNSVAPVSTSPQSCTNGLTFDKSVNECVTDLTYCQNLNGTNATYNSTNNSCSCATGYTLNGNNICAVPESGYQICSEMSSNATWNGTIGSNGKYNCVCQTGYAWNSSGTSCQLLGTPYEAQNGNCYYSNAYDSNGEPLQAQCPANTQQSISPSVSAACQQAQQDVQTAENQENTFNEQSPYMQGALMNSGMAAEVSSGRGQILGQELAGEAQAYATAVQNALEEEQITCQ